MSKRVDPRNVVADLRDEIAERAERIVALRAELETLQSLQGRAEGALRYFEEQSGELAVVDEGGPAKAATNGHLPYKHFTVVGAAAAVLREAGRPLPTAVIAERSKAGGLQSTAADPKRNLFNMLSRHAEGFKPSVVKTAPGMWGLTEWQEGGEGRDSE